MESTETNFSNIQIVKFSKHQPVDIEPIISRKWVTNGIDNDNFFRYKDAYDDSPTNQSIINSIVNYIYGEGLIDSLGKIVYNEDGSIISDTRKTNISKYISKEDVRLIVNDYKTFGGLCVQIIWNSNPADKKPVLFKYFPVFKLGLNIDEQMDVNGYWYSYDWTLRGKYRPVFYPKYTGTYVDGQEIELLVIQRPTSNNFFSQPDYLSCIPYCELEGELANSSINHVRNGFQGSKVVNCNNGVPPTEELKREYKHKIIKDLTGTDNTNKVIVSFNPDRDKGIEVTDINVPELNQQYVYFSEEAERKIVSGHSFPQVLMSSSKISNVLGNYADEIETTTAMFYRKTITPMREVIIDGLQPLFKAAGSTAELEFLDFKTFNKDRVSQIVGNETKPLDK
jgi:hypothetical protein